MNLGWILVKTFRYAFNPSAISNCRIDNNARIGYRCDLSNVVIGKHSYVGHNSFISNTEIGSFCSLGEHAFVGGALHPTHYVSTSSSFISNLNGTKKKLADLQGITTPKTVIENDVWIGKGVSVKAGVRISTGAVIGMGSVVTHDVPAYEIWAGNPAHKIKDRFSDDIKYRLLSSCWWKFEDEKLKDLAPYFNNPEVFLQELERYTEE